MISFLQHLLMVAGAATAVVAVLLIWGILLLAAWDDLVEIVQYHLQSRKDTNLFNQIEEFRRDFS